jgi:hypothetical protein
MIALGAEERVVFLVVDQHRTARGARGVVHIPVQPVTVDGDDGGVLVLVDILGHRSSNGWRLSEEGKKARVIRLILRPPVERCVVAR